MSRSRSPTRKQDKVPYELRIWDKGADPEDPRLSEYNKHINCRYLRNELAIKEPLTIAEIDKMLPIVSTLKHAPKSASNINA